MDAVSSMDRQPEEFREGSKLMHVSSLLDFCARKEALAYSGREAGAPPNMRRVFSGDRILWAIGRAVEHHIRTQFIAAVDYVGVLGWWSCRCGLLRYEGDRDLRSCTTCGDPATVYGEFTLTDYISKIVGNPDMLYRRPDNRLIRVVEIKSMNITQFKELSAPLPMHVMQASLYALLLEKLGMSADDSVTIFYAAKDYHPSHPYKSYTVLIDTPLRARLEDLYLNALERAEWIAENEGTQGLPHSLPPRLPSCSSPQATRAKNCSQCVGCFSNP